MNRVEKFLTRTTLASLYLSTTAMNKLSREYFKCQHDPRYPVTPADEFGTYLASSDKRLKLIAAVVTLREFVDAMDATGSEAMQISLMGNISRVLNEKHGFTYFDWNKMDPSTGTKQLSNVSKRWVLDADVRVLGTLSNQALAMVVYKVTDGDVDLRYGSQEVFPTITVRQMIETLTFEDLYRTSTSFSKTCTKLIELGFGYSDGIFFQHGTVRGFAKELASKHNLTISNAMKLARIVKTEGWKRFPLGE